MSLTDKEKSILEGAVAAQRLWRLLRFALIPVALAAVVGAFFLLGSSDLTRTPLAASLAGLLLVIGVGVTALLVSGWSDDRHETLKKLLQNKQDL